MEEKDILKEAASVMDDKKMISENIRDIVKTCAEEYHTDPKLIRKYFAYRATYGRGWGDTCIEKSEDKVKHPDTVSAAFAKIADIVNVFAGVGRLEELNEYISAVERRGVKISSLLANSDVDVQSQCELVKKYIWEMWAQENHITEVLAPEAEKEGIVPASKFSKYAKMRYSIDYGRGKTDKMAEQIEHEKDTTLMYHDALETL